MNSTTDIGKMDFKQLREKVIELESIVAKMKRYLEDALSNLDTDNFSTSFIKEQGNMKAQIKMTAEELSSVYTRVDENMTTFETQIKQNADEISLKASKTELNQWGNSLKEQISSIEISPDTIELAVNDVIKDSSSDAYRSISSRIQLSKNQILATVSNNSNDYFEINTDPNFTNTTEKQKLMLCLYDGEYYSYDYQLKQWLSIGYAFESDIKTQFLQTSTGFQLSGDVKIDGDLLIDGTIDSSKIITSDLSCNRLYSGAWDNVYNSPYASITPFPSNLNIGFGIYQYDDTNEFPTGSKCVFGINEVIAADTGGMNIYSHGQNFLGHNSKQGKTYPKGIWDFSSCDKVILPDNKVFQT